MKQFFLFLLCCCTVASAQTPFSQDSALSSVRMLAVTIGPRPIGSPQERRAMEYGLSKFREFGLPITYVLQIPSVSGQGMHGGFNTNSGVVVGILPGKTGRIIVIGGHLDSATPFAPGANDNASGAASVIELARICSKQKHESTLMFCLWGGEEFGTCGSQAFIEHDPHVDSIALMLQIDMTDGSSDLVPMIDTHTHSTPRWLVQAAFEEFQNLGYHGLRYPTAFFTLNSILPGGGIGSDHEPFLKKGIPAIDFTSDINAPIHTPQDDFAHLRPSGLKRSGDLVYALVQRFDHGVPPERTDQYLLVQIGSTPIFISSTILYLLLAVMLATTAMAVFTLRRRRTEVPIDHAPTYPGCKLFLIALLLQALAWFSENIVGFLKGVRYPWISHPWAYVVLGFIAAVWGFVLLSRWTPTLKLSHDPYRWYLRSAGFLLVITALFGWIQIKLIPYPAISLLLISAALAVRIPWMKFLLWLFSPIPMIVLLFSDGFPLLARTFPLQAFISVRMSMILQIIYIFLFALFSFPFLLGFAAVSFDTPGFFPQRNLIRSRSALWIASGLFLLAIGVMLLLPSYSDLWRQNIHIRQSLNVETGSAEIHIGSNEYLRNLAVHWDSKDTAISTWDRDILLKQWTMHPQDWMTVENTNTVEHHDSTTGYSILLHIYSRYRPYALTVTYSAGKHLIANVASPYLSEITGHSVSVQWKTFQDSSIVLPIQFQVSGNDRITQTIEASYIEMLDPVTIRNQWSNSVPNTVIRSVTQIK